MRKSNIELLRILAMLMILGLHANYKSLGIPNSVDILDSPIPSFCRVSLEMICIISVNVYVLISGWFTIKASIKGICNFLFQVFFILIITYLIGIILGIEQVTLKTIAQCLVIGENAWFVKSYIALYILSPLLNKFCQTSRKRQLEAVVIGFYVFQTIWGYSSGKYDVTLNGYSTFSFIGLYLLAQYIRKYGKKLFSIGKWLFIFSMILMITTSYTALKYKIPFIGGYMMSYTNPLNIIAATGFLLIFQKIKIKTSSIINYIASSSFAVYLFQDCIGWSENLYTGLSKEIYQHYSGISYIINILGLLFLVFFLGILLDQFRKFFWRLLERYLTINHFFNKTVA